MLASAKEAKASLRKLMRQRVKAVPQPEIERQSKLCAERLLSIAAIKQSKRVSIYLSMPTGEVNTLPIVRQLFDQGKDVYIPKITKSSMSMIQLNGIAELDLLQPDAWGIPSFPDTLNRPVYNASHFDVIVMPGVAFDRSRARLGHGKGYYDRFVSQTNSTRTIALALREQIVDSAQIVMVPDHDHAPHIIVTPDELIQ